MTPRELDAYRAGLMQAVDTKGRAWRSKLNPHEAFPRDLIDEKADISQVNI